MEWGALKLEAVQRFPLVREFLLRAYLETPEDVRQELGKRIQVYNGKVWELFLEGIDLSLYRDDIDKKKALQVLMVAMEGLQQQYAARYRTQPAALIRDANRVFRELAEYMNILKYGVYKRPDELPSD